MNKQIITKNENTDNLSKNKITKNNQSKQRFSPTFNKRVRNRYVSNSLPDHSYTIKDMVDYVRQTIIPKRDNINKAHEIYDNMHILESNNKNIANTKYLNDKNSQQY